MDEYNERHLMFLRAAKNAAEHLPALVITLQNALKVKETVDLRKALEAAENLISALEDEDDA